MDQDQNGWTGGVCRQKFTRRGMLDFVADNLFKVKIISKKMFF